MGIILAIAVSIIVSVTISAIIAFEIMATGYKQLIEQVMELCKTNAVHIDRVKESVISTLEEFMKNKR